MRVPRLIALSTLLAACATSRSAPPTPAQPASQPQTAAMTVAEPFPSTYRALPSRTTLITNATILTATGPTIQRGSLLLRDGKIEAVGTNVTAPADAAVIDA